jgi:hypothetical protein
MLVKKMAAVQLVQGKVNVQLMVHTGSRDGYCKAEPMVLDDQKNVLFKQALKASAFSTRD